MPDLQNEWQELTAAEEQLATRAWENQASISQPFHSAIMPYLDLCPPTPLRGGWGTLFEAPDAVPPPNPTPEPRGNRERRPGWDTERPEPRYQIIRCWYHRTSVDVSSEDGNGSRDGQDDTILTEFTAASSIVKQGPFSWVVRNG